MRKNLTLQSAEDRVRTEYVKKLKAVEAERDQLKGQTDPEEMKALLADLAEYRAEKALLKRKSETLQKAAENKIPLDIAVEFAELENAPDIVDRIAEHITGRVGEEYNAELLRTADNPQAGDNGPRHITWEMIARMSPEEQRRLPHQVVERALEGLQ